MNRAAAILVFYAIFVLSVSICNAKENEWKNQYYNFNNIKTVLVLDPVADNSVLDQFAIQKAIDIIVPELVKLNVKVFTIMDLVREIGRDQNIDMEALLQKDRENFNRLIKENTPKYVDAVLLFKINQLGWTKQYVPPRSFNYTTYETSYYYNSYGSGYIITPKDNQITIPGGYKDFPTAAFTTILVDTKTEQIIWGYTDFKNDKKIFGSNSPDHHLKQIIQTAFKKCPLPKLTKK